LVNLVKGSFDISLILRILYDINQALHMYMIVVEPGASAN